MWTKRTNGSNAEDPSDRLQLDAEFDALVLTAPAYFEQRLGLGASLCLVI
ncbi:MAG: hypothetical protein MZU97_20155 [Bacillus subtilis]|nr:hypothetical protein [Bacillus subtilis]